MYQSLTQEPCLAVPARIIESYALAQHAQFYYDKTRKLNPLRPSENSRRKTVDIVHGVVFEALHRLAFPSNHSKTRLPTKRPPSI